MNNKDTTIKRQPDDGAISVSRGRDSDEGKIFIRHESYGMELSERNARRLLAALSMVLNLPLTKDARKQIEM